MLLRLDLSNVPANRRLHLNGDYPLAWAKMYGKGRVFYGSFAHSSETWDMRDVQQMYFEAMRWALGLTDADPKPHPMRGSAQPRRAAGAAASDSRCGKISGTLRRSVASSAVAIVSDIPISRNDDLGSCVNELSQPTT